MLLPSPSTSPRIWYHPHTIACQSDPSYLQKTNCKVKEDNLLSQAGQVGMDDSFTSFICEVVDF